MSRSAAQEKWATVGWKMESPASRLAGTETNGLVGEHANFQQTDFLGRKTSAEKLFLAAKSRTNRQIMESGLCDDDDDRQLRIFGSK